DLFAKIDVTSKYLSGIQYSLWVEYFFYSAHKLKVDFLHGNRHVVTFRNANAMLAGECSAEFNCEPEYFTDAIHHVRCPLFVGYIFFEDVDVQVAVAEVAITNTVKSKSVSDFFYTLNHCRKIPARYNHIFCLRQCIRINCR